GRQLHDHRGRGSVLGVVVGDGHSRPAAQEADALADGADIDGADGRPSQDAGVAEDILQPRRPDLFNRVRMLHGHDPSGWMTRALGAESGGRSYPLREIGAIAASPAGLVRWLILTSAASVHFYRPFDLQPGPSTARSVRCRRSQR